MKKLNKRSITIILKTLNAKSIKELLNRNFADVPKDPVYEGWREKIISTQLP
jgi:hypothetical protein